MDSGNATGFFDRLGVERKLVAPGQATTRYFDFKTGEVVDFAPPAPQDMMAAFQSLMVGGEKYESFIQGPGYFDFPQPEDIPEELLKPYGEFISNYGAEAAMPMIFSSTGLGFGNITNQMTLFALQAFGAPMARSLLSGKTFTTASGRSQDLYDAVAEHLGGDVYFSSSVISTERSEDGVLVQVKDHKTGEVTEISAKRLLISIEPTMGNTKPFDLDENERAVLSNFEYSRVYTGIINNANLEKGISYHNLPPSAAPDNYLVYPELSFTGRIAYLGSGQYFSVAILGDESLDAQGAKELFQKDFSKLIEVGVLEGNVDDEVSWVDFNVHGPMHARVTEDVVRDGFFQDLCALQGQRSTWWTGGAWATKFQTFIWDFNDVILPMLLEGLD